MQADRLVGGADAVLAIDDTALPKKGAHLVGVAPQCATTLGKNANGERKHYLSNMPANATLKALAASVKARWICKQAHQQMKG